MPLEEKKGSIIENLDPRLKFLLVIIFTALIFLSFDDIILIYNYSLIVILFFLSKLYSRGLKVFIYIAILVLISQLGRFIPNRQFYKGFDLVIHLLERVSVFIIMGIWMASKMKISDFLTAMENIHMPKGITITLAVVFRYLPTVKHEFYYIINTMKLRGIGPSCQNVLLNPVKTIEYSLVPLIIRCMTIADELAVSSMTRGLDLETKRISYREVKIQFTEILITFFFITALTGGRFLIKKL